MPPRLTRSKTAPSKTSKSEKSAETPTSIAQLAPADEDPLRVFILPGKASSEARIISLPSPATGAISRYYVCPTTGFYEFTRIAAPRKQPRSWLLVRDGDRSSEAVEGIKGPTENGHVVQDADAFLATPVDPLFFLAPLFLAQATTTTGKSDGRMFRMEDDMIETLSASSTMLAGLLQKQPFREQLLGRLKQASEVREVGEEMLFRTDTKLFLDILISKSTKMVASTAWPASMEENHVRRLLEAPASILANQPSPAPAGDLQQTTSGAQEPSPTAPLVDPTIAHLMRLRVALDYLFTAYLPPPLRTHLNTLLSSHPTLSFAPLTAHLTHLAALRSKQQALTSLSDNISRKRAGLDDEEAADARAEKKRKKEEEEARKKSGSRAVQQLKKVDVSGMRKMSSFFGKAAPKLGRGKTAP